MRQALDFGAEYVELDVRAGLMGDLVISHDPLTPGSAPERYADALALIASSATGLHLDLKDPHVGDDWEIQAVAAALECLDSTRVVVTTCDAATVALVRGWAEDNGVPDLPVGLSLDERSVARRAVRGGWRPGPGGDRHLRATGRDMLAECDANLAVVEHRFARRVLAEEVARMGLPLLVWTVDDPEDVEFWCRSGAWMLTTNYPERAHAARA